MRLIEFEQLSRSQGRKQNSSSSLNIFLFNIFNYNLYSLRVTARFCCEIIRTIVELSSLSNSNEDNIMTSLSDTLLDDEPPSSRFMLISSIHQILLTVAKRVHEPSPRVVLRTNRKDYIRRSFVFCSNKMLF